MLLRKIGKDLLPPNFNFQRKQGFDIPVRKWGNDGTFEKIYSYISQGETIFEKSEVLMLIEKAKVERYLNEGLYGILLIELWSQDNSCYL